MITEKRLLKISGTYTLIGLAITLLFWFVIYDCGICHAQTQTGYRVPARIDIGGGRMTGDMWCQYGTNGVRFKIGTQAVTQVGTVGVINGTNATALPSLDFTYGGGSLSANFNGFNAVYVAGSQLGTSGALSGKLDATGGVGTNNTFNNPTLAGVGTITATFNANGLDISPAELSMVDGATISLNKATGSITSHTHTGSDGTTQIPHNNITGTGTNSHSTIDTFIASKAQASGLASLDGSSLVVQNPTSATNSPTASKIPIALGTGKLDDSWLSNNITKLGTPTTDNISEGNTNKYYTDVRVNAAVGSLSVNALSDVIIISPANGQFLKYTGSEWINGTSSASVAFSEVTGSATASQLPLISGLLGSATSGQLPTVLKLYGTTTQQAAGAFAQLYVNNNTVPSRIPNDYVLMLTCDNAGTTTFTDSSATPKTITAQGNAIGTSTVILEGGCYLGDGTGDALMVNDHNDLTPGADDFTLGYTFQFRSGFADTYFFMQFVDANNDWRINYENNMSGVNDMQMYYKDGGIMRAYYLWEFNAPSTETNYHFEYDRSGTNFYVFINGISQSLTTSTAIGTNVLGNIAANLYLMAANSLGASLNGKMDGFYFIKGRALHTTNFTPPTIQTPEKVIYTQYSAKYADPVQGNTLFQITSPGTVTTEASYIYCNATTTVFGLGTNTAVTATSTAYRGWFDGAVRATAFNVASTEKIKENIKPIKIKPDLLEAESMAKQNYIAGAKVAWMAANQASYTTIVSETGTGSVTVIDTPAMETAYNNYIELKWATDMNQDVYIENIQKTYEKGFWQMFDSVTPRSWNPKDKPTLTRKGFVVEDMPDVVKGDDGQSIDPMALIAYMAVVHKSMKADTIFALNTLKELITTGTVTQQKIDYVQDRLEVLNP